MKTQFLKSVLGLTFILVTSLNMSAINNHPKDENYVHEEVLELLSSPNFIIQDEMSARITLRINKNNEMIVLSVESKSEKLVDFIKKKLNYVKLKEKIRNKSKNYIIPVKVEPGS